MRRPDADRSFLSASFGVAVGTLAGLVATAAMYALGAADLLLTGVPGDSLRPGIELAFGGSAGSFLGLAGVSLHLVHGALIGAVLGALVPLLRPARPWSVTGAAIGLPVGLVLWVGVLALSPGTRSASGPGPPLFLSLGAHLLFGFVAVALLVAITSRRA